MSEKQVDIQKQLIEKQRAEINKLKETLAGYDSPREDITTATIISDQINSKNQEVILELEQQIQKMVTKTRTLEDQNQKQMNQNAELSDTNLNLMAQNEKLKGEFNELDKVLIKYEQQFNQERTKRLELEETMNQMSTDVLDSTTDLIEAKKAHIDLRDDLQQLLDKYPID